jgi:CO dehydrogenase maturation factor
MKVAVSGKGGVGKTTISALIAQEWRRSEKRVLAIDADPVTSLAGALGFPKPEQIIPLSQRGELIQERSGAKPGTLGQMFILNPRVDDITDKIASEHNGIKLVVMGGVKKGGGGCVCPESALIKALVNHIVLERNENVIMDMEAGIEHLGRGTTEGVDYLLIVVEPSLRSLQTAERIKTLATQIGLKKIRAIGNKIRTPQDASFIRNHLKSIETIGLVPYSQSVVEAEQGLHKRVEDITIQNAIKEIVDQLFTVSEAKL